MSGEEGSADLLLGEFRHSLDAKGRVFLPSRWREELAGGVVVTKGLERCLWVITVARFEELAEQLNTLSATRKRNRDYERIFFGGASEEEIDRQGRITIPPSLREYAGFSREVVLTGMRRRAEIWDRALWTSYRGDLEAQYESIAEELEL